MTPWQFAFRLHRYSRRAALGAAGATTVGVAAFGLVGCGGSDNGDDTTSVADAPTASASKQAEVRSFLYQREDTSSRAAKGGTFTSYYTGDFTLDPLSATSYSSNYQTAYTYKIVQRVVDSWQAMPYLVILITFMGIVSRIKGVNIILAMVLAMGILSIAGSSRVIRSQVLTIKGAAFVEAAESMGASHARIMLTCILPNVFPLILVNATVGLGGVILAEASLSFLGFGPAGEPSWGQMLSVEGRQYMRIRPELAIYPGLFISAAVFGFNIFGDALRDVLDPRLRKR